MRVVSVVFILWFLALMSFIMAIQAMAHDAATGWTYPLACCSDYDCREVPADWFSEDPGGYRIVITGEVVPYMSTKVKNSPDGRWHWCSVDGKENSGTICIFAPARSF